MPRLGIGRTIGSRHGTLDPDPGGQSCRTRSRTAGPRRAVVPDTRRAGPGPDGPSSRPATAAATSSRSPARRPTPGIHLTGGDREEMPDLDAELLDIARMEDPDAGGEVSPAQSSSHPIDDGGEIGAQAQFLAAPPPIDDGGEIARKSPAAASAERPLGPRRRRRDRRLRRGGRADRGEGRPRPLRAHRGPRRGRRGLRGPRRRRTGRHGRPQPPGPGEPPGRQAGGRRPDAPAAAAPATAPASRRPSDGIDGESTRKDHDDWDVQLTEDPDAGGEIAATTPAAPPGGADAVPQRRRRIPTAGGEIDGGFGIGGHAAPAGHDDR